MKKSFSLKSLIVFIMLLTSAPTFANDLAVTSTVTPVETPEAKVERLTKRIEEIRAMDKSAMSRSERKALKKEVRQIKDEVNAISGGVYLSIGALILVIILLIVLL